jgi:hypothetical protein
MQPVHELGISIGVGEVAFGHVAQHAQLVLVPAANGRRLIRAIVGRNDRGSQVQRCHVSCRRTSHRHGR